MLRNRQLPTKDCLRRGEWTLLPVVPIYSTKRTKRTERKWVGKKGTRESSASALHTKEECSTRIQYKHESSRRKHSSRVSMATGRALLFLLIQELSFACTSGPCSWWHQRPRHSSPKPWHLLLPLLFAHTAPLRFISLDIPHFIRSVLGISSSLIAIQSRLSDSVVI